MRKEEKREGRREERQETLIKGCEVAPEKANRSKERNVANFIR